MLKIILAGLLAILISIVVTTFWFLFFGPNGFTALIQEFMQIARNQSFWLSTAILSLALFLLVTLPLTFFLEKAPNNHE